MKGHQVDAENHKKSPCGFDGVMEDDVVDEIMGCFGETEIWGATDEQDENLLADSSIFCNVFPELPDFSCMSSSSSSSSTPAPLTKHFVSSSAASTSSSASSSAATASWAMMKKDAERRGQHLRCIKFDGAAAVPAPALSSTETTFQTSDHVDCMDVMENFGYMDLIEDGNDVWDPSSIFQSDDDDDDQTNYDVLENHRDEGCLNQIQEDGSFYNNMINKGKKEVVNQEKMGLDELGVMFFEWLKTHKEHISIEDMRNIKFKRTTIESASKRLGSTKEGRKQLLKLILEWVEQYQLQKKQSRDREAAMMAEAAAAASHQIPCRYQEPCPNPNPNSNFNKSVPPTDPNTCVWIPTPQTYFDSAKVAPTALKPAMFPPQPPAMAYVRGEHHPFVDSGANVAPMNCLPQHHYQMPQTGYQILESAPSWPPSQYVLVPRYNPYPNMNGNMPCVAPQPFSPVYGDQYTPQQVYNGRNGERIVRLGASATKEARKKRMARQKRGPLQNYRHHPQQNQHRKVDSPEQSEEPQLGIQNCTNINQTNCVNWLYWPAAAIGTPMLAQPHPMEAHRLQMEGQPFVLAQNFQKQVHSEHGQQQTPKQEFKREKNLKFLLQKVLKQSDVGSLGRIVLPKKEAETQLPKLDERDGVAIAMEDISTSKVWNFRYSLRFWPNNKSRMYLLENTGDFVEANGLQEGDFIVVYSDIKYGKYLIRGVKVREPVVLIKPEAEAKAPKAKVTKKNQSNSEAAKQHSSTSSK